MAFWCGLHIPLHCCFVSFVSNFCRPNLRLICEYTAFAKCRIGRIKLEKNSSISNTAFGETSFNSVDFSDVDRIEVSALATAEANPKTLHPRKFDRPPTWPPYDESFIDDGIPF
jgi:hypothetical protein